MSPDPGPIDQYITANRGTYADQAIRERLVSAGHDPAAIDEAFGRLGSRGSATGELHPKPATGLVGFAWVLFAIGGLVGIAGFGAGGYFVAGASVPLFLLTFGAIGLGLIALLAWAIPRYQIGGGAGWLIGLALPVAFFALLYGSCAAAFSTRG